MSHKGRTELIKGVSEAKFHEETDFDVPRSVAPPNPSKKSEKLISETIKLSTRPCSWDREPGFLTQCQQVAWIS